MLCVESQQSPSKLRALSRANHRQQPVKRAADARRRGKYLRIIKKSERGTCRCAPGPLICFSGKPRARVSSRIYTKGRRAALCTYNNFPGNYFPGSLCFDDLSRIFSARVQLSYSSTVSRLFTEKVYFRRITAKVHIARYYYNSSSSLAASLYSLSRSPLPCASSYVG